MAAAQELIIEAGRAERQYWHDLFRYRELFYFLAWRDVLVRYKQTAIGVAWAVLRPLLTTLVFTVVGRLAKLPSEGLPYPVMIFAAMLPWQLFATALTEGSNSLIGNANLISKVYFPRLIVPASATIVSLVDFLISLALLGLMMIFYRVLPDWRLLALLPFTLLASAFAVGASLWLAALNVQYRDFRYIVPFIVQFGIFITPVWFSSSLVPARWLWLYALNPMVGVIDGFRWALSRGQAPLSGGSLALSLAVTALTLAGGVLFFRKTERTFADVI